MIKIPQNKRFSIPNNSDLFGNIWYTESCNFDEEGYIKQSPRSVSIFSKEDDSDFNIVSSLGRNGNASFKSVNNGQPFNVDLSNIFSVTKDIDPGVPGLSYDSRAVFFNNKWYVSTNTGLYYKSGSTWTNTGISLTSGKIHSLRVNKSAQTLLISDGNTIKQIDNSHSTIGLGQLTIPLDYEIVDISYNNNNIAVITKLSDTVATTNDEAYFFIWNGSTSQASQGLGVGSDTIMSITPYNSSFMILTRTGNLMFYNGGGFDIVASFPYYFKNLQITDQSLGQIMQVEGDVLYINVSNLLDSFGEKQEAYIENFPAGIWCYDQKVGLYHRYSPSVSKMKSTYVLDTNVNITTNTMTCANSFVPETGNQVLFFYNTLYPIGGITFGIPYYVIKIDSTQFKVAETYENAVNGIAIDLTSNGSTLNNLVFLTVDDYGLSLNLNRSGVVSNMGNKTLTYNHLIFSGEYQDYDGTSPDPTLCITVPQFKNISSFVTSKIVSQSIEDLYKKVYIKYKPLKTGEKITLKYKDEDVLGIPVTTPQIPSFYTCTWTSQNTLTTSAKISEAKEYFNNKNLELKVTAGAGAGQVAQITDIQESNGVYTITTDTNFLGALSGRKCDIIINNYKVLGEVIHTDTKGYKEFPIALTSKWCNLKVIMEGYEVTIEELLLVNSSHLE
jgi:hypothetical protein